jgi:hypothetical protein
MSNKKEHIDLGEVDFDSLSAEEQILIHRLQGKVGHGDYTKDRHKWLDKIPKEEMRREVLKMSKKPKEEWIEQG